jgi:hypothetical protein
MSSSHSLPQASESSCGTGGASVPVFNCLVILARDAPTGRISARVANLAGVTAEGNAERELLILLTKRFKAIVQDCLQTNREIPWIDPPETPLPGEQQRFIPVHL